ncbi:MAG: molybdenum cofactor biosynthesis protein MoaE [Sphingomonas sp.]|uniref:molybdenum cofactor biosynthesis protein MoaE n=1 Tax=Sphingomonas sp. TaxID=28214 RepID=UPI0025E81655|nr:molybdenum cofactor biosynthesis protein MoaE [Sphingomonas sp.]MBY0285096.1 molybdenum cofactor biosynthesis protein MoaE [Sphingomonas sp.]
MIRVVVTEQPIDLAAELARVEVAGAGGVASFTGLVRADDGVTALELEHYPGATEAALTALATQARDRWDLLAVVIVHRVGRMIPGDRVVFVGAAAAHRAPALDGCAFLIDRLKTGAPFWKREVLAEGARWVEARAGDDAAAARWSGPSADRPAD